MKLKLILFYIEILNKIIFKYYYWGLARAKALASPYMNAFINEHFITFNYIYLNKKERKKEETLIINNERGELEDNKRRKMALSSF